MRSLDGILAAFVFLSTVAICASKTPLFKVRGFVAPGGMASGGGGAAISEEDTTCLLKLYQVSNLQGSASEYSKANLLERKFKKGSRWMNGLTRVERRFGVKSLETIGPCCWKICRNKRGRCRGKIVDGKTRVDNITAIKVLRVKRVKALTNKQCAKWNKRKSSRKS